MGGEQILLEKAFPGFAAENKVLPGSQIARLTILINKKLEYVRMTELENDINALIVVKIKQQNRMWTYITGLYRQWLGTSTKCDFNGKDRNSALFRFKEIIKIFEKVMTFPG